MGHNPITSRALGHAGRVYLATDRSRCPEIARRLCHIASIGALDREALNAHSVDPEEREPAIARRQ